MFFTPKEQIHLMASAVLAVMIYWNFLWLTYNIIAFYTFLAGSKTNEKQACGKSRQVDSYDWSLCGSSCAYHLVSQSYYKIVKQLTTNVRLVLKYTVAVVQVAQSGGNSVVSSSDVPAKASGQE